MSIARWLEQRWFVPVVPARSFFRPPLPWLLFLLLLPLHGLFVWLSDWRRRQYRQGKRSVTRLPVPVVVVGNITVGGAGKTPLTLWLAQALLARGYRPGIVSRGYGRQGQTAGGTVAAVAEVCPAGSARDYGDEPLLLARRSGCPVWVGTSRAAAAQALLAAHPDVNLLLCDDGLQHYALGRDAEIAVFDARGTGNGWRLPLGPLREPLARLAQVDALVFNGGLPDAAAMTAFVPASGGTCLPPAFPMHLCPGAFYALDDPARTCSATALQATGQPLFALAGIGHPQRFFATLSSLGLDCECRAFPDHHAYTADDLAFAATGILLVTEKDAVKCRQHTRGPVWVLPVDAEVPPALLDTLLEKMSGRQAA